MHFVYNLLLYTVMSSNSRVTRSKGESDRLSLPVRTRLRRKLTNMENDDGNTALNTTLDTGSDQHHPQMPVHNPHSDANPHHLGLTPSRCGKLQYQLYLPHHIDH